MVESQSVRSNLGLLDINNSHTFKKYTVQIDEQDTFITFIKTVLKMYCSYR